MVVDSNLGPIGVIDQTVVPRGMVPVVATKDSPLIKHIGPAVFPSVGAKDFTGPNSFYRRGVRLLALVAGLVMVVRLSSRYADYGVRRRPGDFALL